MEKQYLDYNGLQDVAGHVNTRLKTVTTIPASANDGAVRLYVGETGVTYKKGHIYQYNATGLEWIDITNEYTAGNGIDITDGEISVKVANATNGNLAGLDSNGNLIDSGVVADNVIEKVATATGLLRDDGTVDTTTYATTTQLASKADKVVNATVNDFATLDSNGNLIDSGINKDIVPNTATSSNKLATNNDLPTELNDLSDDVAVTAPTNGQILKYNATSSKWENQTEQPPVSGATFKGSILFANIPTTGMSNGDWYDIKDAFTTDNRFEEGAGIECTAGTDIIWVTDDSKWNILTPSGVNSFNGRLGAVVPASGDYDASDIDYDNTTSGLTATDVQDAIDELESNKADNNDIPTAYTNNPEMNGTASAGTSSSWAKGNHVHPTDTSRASASDLTNHINNKNNPHSVTASQVGLGSVVNTGDSATPVSGGTTKFTTGGAYTELNKKVDKVSNPTNGNFAGLDSNGNLTDSGKKASDFMPSDGVEANPQGTATGTLTKLGIGSDIYDIQGGGGGIIIGSSITPVNDIQTLLHCANIYDKTEYTTITNVLADTVILKILIDNNNSADYLVRSTEWADSVCANATAMMYIGDNNYCANKLLDDSTWSAAICESVYFELVLNVKVPVMTSNTTPSGEASASSVYYNMNEYEAYHAFDNYMGESWVSGKNQSTNQYLRYKFNNPVTIKKIVLNNYHENIPYHIVLQYKSDGNWVDGSDEYINSSEPYAVSNFVVANNNISDEWRLFIKDKYATPSHVDGYIRIGILQFYGRANVDNSVTLVPWSTGTDRQISKMINAYYNGTLSLDEIKSVWSIGDVRNVNINPITASGGTGSTAWSVGESHRAQTVSVEILDFNHDLLVTPINGITKALITVDTKDCLRDASVTDVQGNNNTENGYINSTNINNTGWNTCARRAWCNNGFYNALPTYMSGLVKTVYKSTASIGNTSSPSWIANTDKCFLLSEWEVFGTATYSAENGNTTASHYINATSGSDTITMEKGGTQYSWFNKATINKYKNPKWDSSTSTVSALYHFRSPSKISATNYVSMLSTGTTYQYTAATDARELAIGWCL